MDARTEAKAESPKEAKDQQKQSLLAKSEISIWIDTYDDIFSDFDPRPYAQRAISVDFLDEAKRASRDTNQGPQLRFLAPAAIRKTDVEASIKRRLREHFKHHADLLEKEDAQQVTTGIIITIAGFAMAAIAAAISYYLTDTFLATLLVVLLEPAGWFTLWHGMDMAIFERHTKDSELEFYTKMSKAEIVFDSY